MCVSNIKMKWVLFFQKIIPTSSHSGYSLQFSITRTRHIIRYRATATRNHKLRTRNVIYPDRIIPSGMKTLKNCNLRLPKRFGRSLYQVNVRKFELHDHIVNKTKWHRFPHSPQRKTLNCDCDCGLCCWLCGTLMTFCFTGELFRSSDEGIGWNVARAFNYRFKM